MSRKKNRLAAALGVEALETRTLLSSDLSALNYALAFKAPAIILPGSRQTATLQIKNTGNSLIETFLPITVDVSDAPTLAADSKQQTILTIDPGLRLMGGKSKNMAIHFTMPATFVTGTCYILVNVDGQVFSTSAMYNPSGGYASGTYGNAPATATNSKEYLDTGTWTASGQTNTFSINLRSVASGAVYADVLASGNFGEISMSGLPAHITPQGKLTLHATGISATIYPPGSSSSSGSGNNNTSGGSDSGSGGNGSSGGSDSGTSGGTDSGTGSSGSTGSSGTSGSNGTEEVGISISGKINSGQIDGKIQMKSVKPATTTGTTGGTGTTGTQAAEQTSGSSSTYTPISGSGDFDVAPPAQSAGSAPAVVIDMSQLPAITSGNITLTGNYPSHSYVGTISVALTNSHGNPLAPFTSYTVNTSADTWAVPISIAGVPDGKYTVNATDTNTSGTSLTPDSGGSLTISTIGANVHFSISQLPLVTNTNQTLSGTYDATDADGGQITHITVCLTDSTGKQTFFPATLGGGTWSAPVNITGLTDGAYTVTATASDASGNAGTAGAPGTFTIDTLVNTLGPDVTITSPGPWMATPNTPYTLKGTYSEPTETGLDGNPDTITAIIINLTDSQGATKSFPAILSSPDWIALINVGSLAAGTYTVSETIFDSNGSTVNSPAPGTFTVLGLSPAEMRGAYGLGQIGSSPITFNGVQGDGTGQTIAIVDAYDDPNAQSDLQAFDQQFALPDPPSFEKLNQDGLTTPLPNTDPAGAGDSWAGEESLDIEWAHAMAPGANIVLIEANPASTSAADTLSALTTAAQAAANTPGVDVVSMSWGFSESGVTNEAQYDSIFATPGITFVASSGDSGASTNMNDSLSVLYPAASPNVVAVGGTVLTTNGNTYSGETAWSGGGGGVSVYESQPSYQKSSGLVTQSSTQRTVPDVSMDAAPITGVPIYDSFDSSITPWMNEPFGGTSLAAPMFAGVVAIADQGLGADGMGSLSSNQTLQALYSAGTASFHDITSGSNGYYSAASGYDLVTGLGSPVANRLVPKLAGMSISGAQPALAASSFAGSIGNSLATKSAQGLNTDAIANYRSSAGGTTNAAANSTFSSLQVTDSGSADSTIISHADPNDDAVTKIFAAN